MGRAVATVPDVAHLTITQVAREVGLRTSAIRYYERIGILPRAERVSGRRRYGPTALHRLAVVLRARETGFTLREIRTLFAGFRDEIPADERWRRLAGRKLAELDAAAARIAAMRRLLERLRTRCHCRTLEACGKAMFEHGYRRGGTGAAPFSLPRASVNPDVLVHPRRPSRWGMVRR